mgnify:CR=1 FL=1
MGGDEERTNSNFKKIKQRATNATSASHGKSRVRRCCGTFSTTKKRKTKHTKYEGKIFIFGVKI